jgi:dihydrofolate reductase/thymidylate synthase
MFAAATAVPAALKGFVVIVAATSSTLGIGKNGALPWKLAADMAFFKRVTSTTRHTRKQNAVIMGRKTWEVCCVHTLWVR